MNRKMIFRTVGEITLLESALLLIPMIVSLIYGESCWLSFLISSAIALVIGLPLTIAFSKVNSAIYAKEGFITVSFAWILLSLIGALPFTISGEIPNYINALFETVSGFTTTGATILNNIEIMSKGLLFWRSFTHWIGGMGVLVLIMAIIPSNSGHAIHIMRAEMPGPSVGKIVPKIRETAKILYLIYIGMTVLEVVMLLCGGMNLFESLVHTFGTAGTGGFGVKADSIAGYSPYIQWVIGVFMVMFGINFNIFFMILIGKIGSAFKSTELLCYIGIIIASTAAIVINIWGTYDTFGETLRTSFFQVSSIITTTGYTTADFNTWPVLSKVILFVLMFVGACAGSTGGGLKVSRLILLTKIVKNDITRALHPRSVNTVKFEGRTVEKETVNYVTAYFILYIFIYVIMVILLCIFDGWADITSVLSGVSACYNNIGPGLGAFGPASNYEALSWMSKIVLIFAMLLGRLEIYPFIVMLRPSTWSSVRES